MTHVNDEFEEIFEFKIVFLEKFALLRVKDVTIGKNL